MPLWFIVLCAMVVITSALSAGLFFTFSDFLMRAFGMSEDRAGIEVMQVLNREILKSKTAVFLFGNIPLSTGLAIYAYVVGPRSFGVWLALGALSYLVFVLFVSYAVNVPMNEELDPMDKDSMGSAIYWKQSYVKPWVFWNWIRTFGAVTTSLCFLVASLRMI